MNESVSVYLEARLHRILEGVELISERMGAIANRLDAADRRLELMSTRAEQWDDRIRALPASQQSLHLQPRVRMVVYEAYTTSWCTS